MTISISNLAYVAPDHVAIDMDVTAGQDTFPFTYVPGDSSPVSQAVAALLQSETYEIAPYVAPAIDTAALLAYAAHVRWQAEVGGIIVSGMSVATDDRSKQMVIGARLAALADGNFQTFWKVAPGAFVTIGAAEIMAISDAVSTHVAACFAKEGEVTAAIIGETITTFAEIDAAFALIDSTY